MLIIDHRVVNIVCRIPDDHPDAQHLRHKLTIINQKHRRGLLTDAQAELQRHEAQQAIQRQFQPDWQPSKAAQQQISQRHQQATLRFAEKLGLEL
ncbi:hypothetical protein LRS06_02650 [Hymenobacter sp. J193]|uniref:hypothetical protein n=1 Tax=Hymenobacter sp. J193 TaxID=2898429 RepID=UPI002151C3D9|nr:hypothetical protein [Hymenobacter sp. J193]MCR5886691.1 hypothetical protein [Hymenobacter sp. J193]